MAALALRARVAELLDDLTGAFGRYLAIQSNHSASALKVIQLRSQAVSTIGQEIKNALGLGHLDGAVERLEQLQEWAPGEVSTLELQREVVAAKLVSNDLEVATRRAILEVEVGEAGLGLGILQQLVDRFPENLMLAEDLGRAKFRWRLMVLPERIRELADLAELNRGDFAALLYWLFPEVRYGRPEKARIANDILGHDFRDEIVKVANLGLVKVDSVLHRFNPELALTRGTVIRSLLSLFEQGHAELACLGNWRQSLSPSVEFVCQAAASCGLILSPADCLPEATVSGQVVIEMGRLAQDQLESR
jgi:hypothetical protein